MEAIRTERLSKRYKDILAVDGLDLTVAQGELFALLGVAVTWGTVKHILYRYDHSFYN